MEGWRERSGREERAGPEREEVSSNKGERIKMSVQICMLENSKLWCTN